MIANRFAGYRFRPGWFMTIVTIAFCALTVTAGNWQRGRAETKAALQQKLDDWSREPPVAVPGEPVRGEDYALRPVQARGVYAPRYGILLDNKVYRGRAGYHIITPLKIDGSDMYVLVVRGWAPGGPTRDVLPEVATPAGVQTVQGIGMVPSTRVLELASEPEPGRVWQNLLLDRYRAWSHLKLQPFVIEQTGDAADGLVRDWPRPDLGVEKHRVYMMQWYAFTALALILYVVLNFKRNDGSTRQ